MEYVNPITNQPWDVQAFDNLDITGGYYKPDVEYTEGNFVSLMWNGAVNLFRATTTNLDNLPLAGASLVGSPSGIPAYTGGDVAQGWTLLSTGALPAPVEDRPVNDTSVNNFKWSYSDVIPVLSYIDSFNYARVDGDIYQQSIGLYRFFAGGTTLELIINIPEGSVGVSSFNIGRVICGSVIRDVPVTTSMLNSTSIKVSFDMGGNVESGSYLCLLNFSVLAPTSARAVKSSMNVNKGDSVKIQGKTFVVTEVFDNYFTVNLENQETAITVDCGVAWEVL